MDEFIKLYFREIGTYFKDLIDSEEIISHVWAGTYAMINNQGKKSNEHVFMETFRNRIKDDLSIYQERFDRFYDDGFLKVRVCTKASPFIKNAVKVLKDKGYTLAVATNPLFPRKAVLHRIEWADLDPCDFDYITSYEKNHFCKPRLEFYKEVLESLGKQPHQCIMVGNDAEEDMVASKLGIKTYLITNHLINNHNLPIQSDYQGTYEEFYKFVCSLPETGRTAD